MSVFSFIILLLMALFNGAAFVGAISTNNPDDYSQLMLYLCLPVAIGCVLILLKKKLGFTVAIAALIVIVLGTYVRVEATEAPFVIQIILLLISVYLPKDGISLWKRLE